jgi:hypothetical protein
VPATQTRQSTAQLHNLGVRITPRPFARYVNATTRPGTLFSQLRGVMREISIPSNYRLAEITTRTRCPEEERTMQRPKPHGDRRSTLNPAKTDSRATREQILTAFELPIQGVEIHPLSYAFAETRQRHFSYSTPRARRCVILPGRQCRTCHARHATNTKRTRYSTITIRNATKGDLRSSLSIPR